MKSIKQYFMMAALLGLAVPVLAASKGEKKTMSSKTAGLYATIITSKGNIEIKLFPDKTPITVANFVELAQGKREWTDPKTGQKVKRPLYDNTIFHRVIPNFMIQGGDPLGNGTGGPGYRFQDEIVSELMFDRPGLLAMANSGPGTNGSQFFITDVPTPWLNGHHTIFGEVVSGMDTVKAIISVPRGAQDRPEVPVVIKTIKIEEIK